MRKEDIEERLTQLIERWMPTFAQIAAYKLLGEALSLRPSEYEAGKDKICVHCGSDMLFDEKELEDAASDYADNYDVKANRGGPRKIAEDAFEARAKWMREQICK